MAKKKTSKPVKKPGKQNTIAHVTDSEWKILAVLWDRGPIIASQIQASLKQKWTQGAVYSFLKRLVKKKLVCCLKDEGEKIVRFGAVYDRETLLREKSRIFLEQYFNGSFQDFALLYLAGQKIPAKKIDALIKQLKSQS